MNIRQCVEKRKSIRGFKKDPVSRHLIEEILELSVRSPSGLNTQAWDFLVVAGDVLEAIRKANIEKYESGTNPDSVFMHRHQGVYRQRQVTLAKQLFSLMDIARNDNEKREEWTKKGIRFFDAPAAVIVKTDAAVRGKFALFDLGLVTQTICLVALSYGLGTCIEMQGVMYPEVIRNVAGLPGSKQIIVGIAMGYPDWDFPANRIQTEREPIPNVTTWRGFDE